MITTLHDPTLAARFADRVLLLHGDGRWTLGPVSSALTTQALSELYLTPMLELGEHGRRVFVTRVRAASSGCVQRAVAGQHARGRQPHLPAGKVGEGAAGLAHDDGQRGDVQDVHVGLDDHIQRAARQQVVVHEVPVAADAADAADQGARSALPLRAQGERLQVAGREVRRGQLRGGADPHRLVIEEGAAAALGPGQLPVGRRAGDPEHQLPLAHERDLRGEERRPRTKDLVPSIGSTSHTFAACIACCPPSSP